MQTFINFLKEKEAQQEKHVVLVYGRMNPPSLGHLKVVDKVHEVAEQYNADHYVVLSHKQEKNKNPLTTEQKLKHVQRFFPETNISFSDKENPGIIQQVRKLTEDYTHLHIVCGEDRITEYQDLIEEYNGKEFNFKKVFFHSSGERDDSADVSGISGTKMRSLAAIGNYSEFVKCIPESLKEDHKKELYFDVRKGMGLHMEAIFVIGPPGCGKDIFISQMTEKYGLPEIDIDQVNKRIIQEKQILVSGGANDFNKVSKAYNTLEESGYDCMIFYVHVSDEESKIRHLNRSLKEGKPYTQEPRRYKKWLTCFENISKFGNLAKDRFLFLENSGNLQETIDQLRTLFPTIHTFFSGDVNLKFDTFMEDYGEISSTYGFSPISTNNEPMTTLKDKEMDDSVPPSKKKKTLKDFKKKND